MITEGLRKLVTLASQCALIRLQQDYHGSDLISNPTRGKVILSGLKRFKLNDL